MHLFPIVYVVLQVACTILVTFCEREKRVPVLCTILTITCMHLWERIISHTLDFYIFTMICR
jgi:hypothetical protein